MTIEHGKGSARAPEPSTWTLPALPAAGGSLWVAVATQSVRPALEASRAHLFRSLLTMISIAVGVGGVLVMSAVGQAQEAALAAQMARYGSNMVVVSPQAAVSGRTAPGGSGAVLTNADALAMRAQVSHVLALSPEASGSESLVAGRRSYATTVMGAYPEIQVVQGYGTRLGAFFTAEDDSSGAPVAVLGQTVVDRLFPDGDHMGAQVRIGNVPFRVVGVLKRKGHDQSRDLDDIVIIPLNTAQRRLFGPGPLGAIVLQVDRTSNIADVIAAVSAVLRQAHRIPDGRPNDFVVGSYQRLVDAARDQETVLGRVLAAVAAAALIMGGFGVMNLTLISVAERTHEIGIRLAVGARSRDILLQFLVEALILALAGGGLGTLLGFAASAAIPRAVTALAGYPAMPAATALVAALAVSGLTGVTFGSFPALRASRLDVVEALRCE